MHRQHGRHCKINHDVKVFFLKSEKEMQKTLRQHLQMVYKSQISVGNLCCTVSQERFLARKMRIRTMLIIPKLFLIGVEYCATFQAALYIDTHSLMHRSEFHTACVALSRAADIRKSLINIHKNRYTATLSGLKYMPRLTRSSCNAITEFANVSMLMLYGN